MRPLSGVCLPTLTLRHGQPSRILPVARPYPMPPTLAALSAQRLVHCRRVGVMLIEPSTYQQRDQWGCAAIVCPSRAVDIGKVGVTPGRALIPPEHGVDSLGEFGAAAYVDAASVNPDVVVSILLGPVAAALDLCEAFLMDGKRLEGSQMSPKSTSSSSHVCERMA
ncbi:hypothetical protein VTI74DRAFT_9219 [Chaetomium olivicolor]